MRRATSSTCLRTTRVSGCRACSRARYGARHGMLHLNRAGWLVPQGRCVRHHGGGEGAWQSHARQGPLRLHGRDRRGATLARTPARPHSPAQHLSFPAGAVMFVVKQASPQFYLGWAVAAVAMVTARRRVPGQAGSDSLCARGGRLSPRPRSRSAMRCVHAQPRGYSHFGHLAQLLRAA